MRLGVPREVDAVERRVAATPATVRQLTALGHDVLVEAGAGEGANYFDAAFAEAGAQVVDKATVWDADLVVSINPPSGTDIASMREGAVLVSVLSPMTSPDLIESLRAKGLTALALDAVPRISRAQSIDVLSSMANLAGYRAVVEAAHAYGGLFTGQVTAAGKVPPARVFVAGAGVAGLAAIGAAGSLGAVVRAFDVRPEVAEQVESMGAEFIRLADVEQQVSEDGYAKETGEEFNRRAAVMYAEQVKDADIVVTTALIRGRKAPVLITADMVAAMHPGAVIVDMAAGHGGNVEGSLAGAKVVTDNGVTIIGYTDLANNMPGQASQLFGTNVVNLLKLLTPEKDGNLVVDLEDEVIRGMTVAHHGETLWPPPPVKVSAAPTAPAPASGGATAVAAHDAHTGVEHASSGTRRMWQIGLAAVLFLALASVTPAAFLAHLTVFMLAVVVGYYVIGNVHHALHTPLMSVTNAISGIIVVGAMLQLTSTDPLVLVLAFLATLVASINVVGGFTVTQRMLTMFRKA